MKTTTSAKIALATIIAAISLPAEELNLEWIGSGAMKQFGNYYPQQLKLTANKPMSIHKVPPGLSAPQYGEIKMGGSDNKVTYAVILDEPAGKSSRLFVDANHNGDLTDDDPPTWEARSNRAGANTTVMYFGGATLPWPDSKEGRQMHLDMYRFDKNDTARVAFKNSLFYYRDYGWKGEVLIGGRKMRVLISDDMASGSFAGKQDTRSGISFYIDVNGDGRFAPRGEVFDALKPFNIHGTTYELRGLNTDGSGAMLVKSDKEVAEIKPPPTVGEKALPFTHQTLDGKTVKFPEDYKGKLVMLDFWATWCGPCKAELPNLIANYNQFHGKRFDVLGITLDNANTEQKVRDFTRDQKMAWPQVYDGKGWQAEIGQLYSVSSIPHCLLVDADSGKIVATTESLRGPALKETLDKHVGDAK